MKDVVFGYDENGTNDDQNLFRLAVFTSWPWSVRFKPSGSYSTIFDTMEVPAEGESDYIASRGTLSAPTNPC